MTTITAHTDPAFAVEVQVKHKVHWDTDKPEYCWLEITWKEELTGAESSLTMFFNQEVDDPQGTCLKHVLRLAHAIEDAYEEHNLAPSILDKCD